MHKVVFDRAITTRDLQEQLAVSVGLSRLANVILKAKGDTIITISPTMLGNNSRLVIQARLITTENLGIIIFFRHPRKDF